MKSTEAEIGTALRSGGLDAVEELFYPGDGANYSRLKDSLPIPQGTGRNRWPDEKTVILVDRGSAHIGIRRVVDIFYDDTWVGCVKDVSGGTHFSFSHYETHDGERFAHANGPTGAYTWIKDRYWLYGNPPTQPVAPNWLRKMIS